MRVFPLPQMQRLLFRLNVLATSVLTLSPKALALPSNGVNNINGLNTSTDIIGAIVDVIVIILDFVAILAVLFVIIAGLRLIISGGDEGEKDKAKQTIIYVIAGIIVILFARVIVVYVANVFSD